MQKLLVTSFATAFVATKDSSETDKQREDVVHPMFKPWTSPYSNYVLFAKGRTKRSGSLMDDFYYFL